MRRSLASSVGESPLLAFDLFRFKGDTIVEHWGGQQPELSGLNLSGHTQVDGPTAVEDDEKTEANRTLVQTYREIITVQQHYDRIGDFLADNHAQHAEGFGDGIARVKAPRPSGDNCTRTGYALCSGWHS